MTDNHRLLAMSECGHSCCTWWRIERI